MLERSYGTSEPVPLSVALSESLERIKIFIDEVNSAIESLKTCPSPCDDQTVEISTPSQKSRRVACPLASKDCYYGSQVAVRLNEYLIGIMAGIGVPSRHLGNVPNALGSMAVSAAESWQSRGFLVLTGIPGVGKSFGAVVAVKKQLTNHIGNWFDRRNWDQATKAAETIMWSSAKEIADDRSVASRAKSCRFAVIDDLGKEDDTRMSVAAIRDAISKRYDTKLPTVITSELTILDIRERYGQYIAERLSEDYCSKIIDCAGESFRLKDRGNVA